MKATKKLVKNYQGNTYVFDPVPNIGYKVFRKGFMQYWFQTTASVREAKRISEK